MRVLYVEEVYPQLSESYVAHEIDQMLRFGVEIQIWSRTEPVSLYPEQVRVHRGAFEDAVKSFKPDIVHFHFRWEIQKCPAVWEHVNHGNPATWRGHSVDHAPDYVRYMGQMEWMKKIYVFPHLAVEFKDLPKVQPLSSCYNPKLYYSSQKNKRLVVRVGAGLPYKDIQTFLSTALLCRDHTFLLILGSNAYTPNFVQEMKDLRDAMQSPVQILDNLQHHEAASIVRDAGIMLHTYKVGGHPFGNPVSVLEALATGSYVLLRETKDAYSFGGDACAYYGTPEHAASIIQGTHYWDDGQWNDTRALALSQAKGKTCEEVLRPVFEDWKTIIEN